MIKKLAALGIISTLAFAPVVAFADDAAPATPAASTDTAKPMKAKPMKKKSTHHSMKKKTAKPMATPMATETPKS